ncbi:isochorismatase family protein [Streptomyces sp. WMMC905]|uniref:isochorismatase family protein n=1 Tax=Streptomyces sp. WMMC905 TaxID=3404123 RepID=UPI003B93E2AE
MAGLPTIETYPLPSPGDLPTNSVRWTVDPARAVLLVHDMQRYFLKPFAEPLRTRLVHNATTLRREALARGIPVAYTAQPGGMTDDQRGLLKDFWGPGMRPAPGDRQIVEPLAPTAGDWLLTKWRYSAFFRTGLLDLMRSHDRDQLIICGVYAHVGVITTAIESFSHDIQTFLVADAIADFDERHHHATVEYAARRCAVVTTTKETLA